MPGAVLAILFVWGKRLCGVHRLLCGLFSCSSTCGFRHKSIFHLGFFTLRWDGEWLVEYRGVAEISGVHVSELLALEPAARCRIWIHRPERVLCEGMMEFCDCRGMADGVACAVECESRRSDCTERQEDFLKRGIHPTPTDVR